MEWIGSGTGRTVRTGWEGALIVYAFCFCCGTCFTGNALACRRLIHLHFHPVYFKLLFSNNKCCILRRNWRKKQTGRSRFGAASGTNISKTYRFILEPPFKRAAPFPPEHEVKTLVQERCARQVYVPLPTSLHYVVEGLGQEILSARPPPSLPPFIEKRRHILRLYRHSLTHNPITTTQHT
jgi:hypothetical protein